MRIYVGYDEREAVVYHTFCNSVLTKASRPISFIPLALNTLSYRELHTDGSNAFIYSRFLVPYLNDYQGWALFVDGDMICNSDIKKLFDLIDESKAVMVVKHDYKTKHPIKYLGNKNEDYPRKNWSSVILWNCGHAKNKVLSPQYIQQALGSHLHRFAWLDDSDIGELPNEWNWLVLEQPENPKAKLLHYTVGSPCFMGYRYKDHSREWFDEYFKTIAPL